MALMGTGRDESNASGGGSESTGDIVQEASTFLTDPKAEKLCEVFADGLESGLGYARLFDMLERSGVPAKAADRLERGDLLGEAFARFGILDPRARKLVLVAEKQGRLPPTFRELADMYGDRYDRKKDVVVALAEPMIWIALAIFLFNLFGSDLTSMVLASDTYQQTASIAVTAALQIGVYALTAFVTLFGWLHLPVDFTLRELFTRLWIRLPFAGQPLRLRSVATFCRYMNQSISTGLNVHKSLALAAEASNNGKLMAEIDEARKKLEEGSTLAEALFGVSSLPDEVIEYIDIAEESGKLEERFESLADDYAQRAEKRGNQYLTALTWILRVVIIVALIVMLFTQIFQMASEL
ncbi:MAG: type II secretion system F family protein [Bradymonadaceae bacterium]